MLVKTEKIKVNEIVENACPTCDGVGKITVVPYDGRPSFKMDCGYCFGEKIVTANLVERKNLAAKLRGLLGREELTIREASKKFGGTFMDWNNAKQGRASLEEIETKIKYFYD